jgi:hypothetical protein
MEYPEYHLGNIEIKKSHLEGFSGAAGSHNQTLSSGWQGSLQAEVLVAGNREAESK